MRVRGSSGGWREGSGELARERPGAGRFAESVGERSSSVIQIWREREAVVTIVS